jgi:hypothetical protein
MRPSTPHSAPGPGSPPLKSQPLSQAPTLRPGRLHLHQTKSNSDLRASSSTSTDLHNATAPSTPGTAHAAQVSGLRAQLRHLLPKHALFHVRINIHELSSVPLVHGEFCLRWKFKHVHSVPASSASLLGMVSGRSKAKEKEKDDSETEGSQTEGGASPTSAETSPEAPNDLTDDDKKHIPSFIISNHQHHDFTSFSKSPPNSSLGIMSPEIFSPLPSDWLQPPRTPLASSSPSRAATPISLSLSASTPADSYAAARGMTEYVKLKDHNVIWEHKVDVVVRMDVERDTTDLLQNEVKFTVMQVSTV